MLPNVSILFGGAKGLSYKYDLCNDCFLFRTEENTWTKLSSVGDIPCPRAAHAAAAIDQTHLAIFGGAKMGGALAPDDLYVLQLSYEDKRSYWIKLENTGAKPGSRYGHTMCYYKPYLLIIGGNLGTVISNEVWICNIENSFSTNQISWSKLDCGKNLPCPRMYHASSLCKYGGANNMVIVFGGRGEKNNSLNDCWGLRKHRNGNWDWVSAPYTNTYTPQKRFQHTVNFFYNFLIVLGGRNESKDTLSFPIEIYDTENSEWTCVSGFNKFRHTSWLSEGALFTHGGFELSNTTVAKNDLIKIDINKMFNSSENLKKKYEKLIEEEKKKKLANSKKNTPNLSPVGGIPPLRQKVMNMTQMEKNQIRKELKQKEKAPMSSICIQKPQIQKYGECASSDYQDKLLIQQVQFDDKWNIQPPTEPKDKPLHDIFIEYLLRPSVWLNEENEEAKAKFHFGFDEIAQLTKQCLEIIANQPNILKVSTPVKVFGDIHGQFIDLMNFFDKWGCPSETMNGDIMMNDYLFLGDYVDRGNMSLETICLLMALKVKYPDQIHLLRGNHEDILINSGFGFQEECERRLNDDSESEDSLFRLINNFFEYLPLAAVIDDEILCVHGGIGANVRLLSDIDGIKRPFEVIHEAETRDQKLVMDILWSDPTDSDEELS
ncbi:MAG: metallophosphoesterase, partial [archaeon]|nr:metallophosphoesterase [archaeon]